MTIAARPVSAAILCGCLALLLSLAPGSRAAPLSEGQLDRLTAPIALYSDPLLGAVLTASTYPLEVVEAARWLDDPNTATLQGDARAAALQRQPWDASVKTLVSFPDVLRMMNANLAWTEQIGDAFLAGQAAVMDSVQRLRRQASESRRLQSTPQQTVSSVGPDIEIEPADPEVIYVPYYVPTDLFSPWPWPDYPPWYFDVPSDILLGGALIGFGIGVGFDAFGPFWAGWQWDWPHHGLRVFPYGPRWPGHGPGGPNGPNGPKGPKGPGTPWQHDPEHRRGVPYHDAGVRARYGEAASQARREFRGFAPAPVPVAVPARGPEREGIRESAAAPSFRSSPMFTAPGATPRPAAPAFESFGRGPDVRGEAARGAASRSAPPAPTAPASRPAASGAGSSRGGGGGRR